MKQINIINAYNLLEELSNIKDLTEQEYWSLYNLRKKLRYHVEFYKEREEAIKSKYLEFVTDDGKLEGDKAREYLSEIEKLNNMESELEPVDKPEIRLVKEISFTKAEQLEDFIKFISC